MAAKFPPNRYLTFFGGISVPTTNSFRSALCSMVNEGAKQITILFASPGGSTEDGIALYTYLTALPVELTMHAVGVVASMAIPLFLAAPKRLASRNARFLFHEYAWTHPQATVDTQSTMYEHSLRLNDALAWSKETVKAKTTLTDNDFDSMKLFDHPFMMDPTHAAKVGLISTIAEPVIVAASQPRVVM